MTVKTYFSDEKKLRLYSGGTAVLFLDCGGETQEQKFKVLRITVLEEKKRV
jgi:hypothetical protein